ncbi:DUF4190 domain-containing protein [Agromyces flavus]|uniref:DUF4190 domain-containing protein n=1 Tax=Agromyces flavus TaxID=589382 RepID=UPI000B8297AB|nr:DUF4190 domain-containing protein [Agromyces flavus]
MNDAAPVPPPAPVTATAPFPPVPPAPPAPPATAVLPAPGAWSANAYGAADPYAASPVVPVGPGAWSAPAAPRQNILAWVSFGLGLGSLFFGLLSSIAAIVTGHIARRQLRASGEQGDWAALTGLISGYVITALWVLGIGAYILFIVVMIGAAAASSGVGSGI